MAVECKRSTVIAKLIGYDPHPVKQAPAVVKRCVTQDLLPPKPPVDHNAPKCSQPADRRLSDIMSPPCHLLVDAGAGEMRESRGVCEEVQQLGGGGVTVDVPIFSAGNRNEADEEKRMGLVLENLMEAKRLSLNKGLLQSKEFGDALEVLSSNCDLFLRLLRERNTQISRHLEGLQKGSDCSTLPKHPNRSVCVDRINAVNHLGIEDNNKVPPKSRSSPQATRIVVLKPGLGQNNDLKSLVRSTLLPSLVEGSRRDPFEAVAANEDRGVRDAAKKITCQMQKTITSGGGGKNKRTETLSFLLSRECAEDSSFFDGSEKEGGYVEEDEGTSSASQNTDPTSQGSWDFVNRLGSHYSASSSSLTRQTVTHFPESSIFREARKRLSERWLVVASNRLNQEATKHLSRSSSTLAEMLSVVSVAEKTEQVLMEGDEQVGSRACVIDEEGGGTAVKDVPRRSLKKSNSVPQCCYSPSSYENGGFSGEVLGSRSAMTTKDGGPVSVSKSPKRSMSLLRGKVASLFLLRKKKGGGGGGGSTPDCKDSQVACEEDNHSGDVVTCNGSECGSGEFRNSGDGVVCSQAALASSDPSVIGQDDVEPETCSSSSNKERLPLEKLLAIESNEEQEQPSPVSVLQAPFEVDSVSSWSQSFDDGGSHELQQECQALDVAASSLPPSADTTACCLTFDEATTSETEEEEGEGEEEEAEAESNADLVDYGEVDAKYHSWLEFVKLLLSFSGLSGETSITVLRRWHSVDSPLDPALLGKFLEAEDEEVGGVAMERRGSSERLLFDCVNATLREVSETDLLEAVCGPKAWLARGRSNIRNKISGVVMCHVIDLLRPDETWSGRDHGALIRSVTRKEATDGWWARETSLEAVAVGAEIQGLILDELVVEILADVF